MEEGRGGGRNPTDGKTLPLPKIWAWPQNAKVGREEVISEVLPHSLSGTDSVSPYQH